MNQSSSNSGIFSYGNYREFLLHHFATEKNRQPSFSYRNWARRLGLKSAASIQMVLGGKRHPGQLLQEKLETYFMFSKKERLHFDCLIRLAKAGTDERKRARIFALISRLPTEIPHTLIHDKTFELLCGWQHFAIIEMTNLKGFRGDPLWIRHRLLFPLSVTQIMKSCEKLRAEGMLSVEGDGTMKRAAPHFTTNNGPSSMALRHFHKEMIQLASTAVDKVAPSERQISSVTFSVRKEAVDTVKEEIFAFQKQLMERYEAREGDQVYQLNIQFFPLTKSI